MGSPMVMRCEAAAENPMAGKGRNCSRTKRKGRGQRKCKAADVEEEDPTLIHNENDKSLNETEKRGELCAPRKMPKRAAACSNFKEKTIRLSEISSMVESKQDVLGQDENEAVNLTKLDSETHPPCRKLTDFILHDADGRPQPFEMSEFDDIFITAIIMPLKDTVEKEKERGVKCEGFGRIETWSISGYEEGLPVIWVSTEVADYECVKPASSYKKFYDLFFQKACICVEVYRKLSDSNGRNPDMSLDGLIAAVLRSMSGSKSLSIDASTRDFVVSIGEFIYNQLVGLDESSENKDVNFATLPVLLALREECKNRLEIIRSPPLMTSDGSLKIKDGNQQFNEDEDEKLARLLQEEENFKLMKQQRNKRAQTSSNKFYIKINEDEIANDYPLPTYYKPCAEEMDEFLFFDTDPSMCYSDDLPRRVLRNWSLYNSDSRLISLELIPMKPCAEDVTIFGSGNMAEDDGCLFGQEANPGQSSSTSMVADHDGVPIYLSAVKEWMIEFGSSMIFISIRTDVAWYRLEKPVRQYSPWYEPVLKTARLAISIITLLKEQSRVSKLPFSYVIRKISEFDKCHPAYISSNLAEIERYVVVHGQIILQQFAEYPDDMIRKSAFLTGLLAKMEERNHTKLAMKKKMVFQKERNLNPRAEMAVVSSKRNAMRATTTRLINRIWRDYYSNTLPENSKDVGDMHILKEEEELEEKEGIEDEEAEEEIVIVQDESPRRHSLKTPTKLKYGNDEVKWKGDAMGTRDSGEPLYSCAIVRGEVVAVCSAVTVEADESEDLPTITFVEYMYEKPDGTKMVHGRMALGGSHTVLGNASNDRELFLTNECLDFDLRNVRQSVVVDIRLRKWGHEYRKEYANADRMDGIKAEERKKKGLPTEYYCKSLYWPQRGGFFALPFDTMGLGTGACYSCKVRKTCTEEFRINTSKVSFIYKSTEYSVHDFVYVRPEHFGDVEEDKGTFKAGRNVGLKAYAVCQLLEIEPPKGSKQPTVESTQVKVRRFYRPEDVSSAKAYCSDIREVYYSDEIVSVPVETLEGKCEVRRSNNLPNLDLPIVRDHIFFCEYSYNPSNGAVNQLPASVKFKSIGKAPCNVALRQDKGKGKWKVGEKDDNMDNKKGVHRENRLTTLDIFAGCGGLSEGLQQSGVSFTKWAIEYDQPAGDAFNHNHPDALAFVDNCNVILRAIMEKCGDIDDCISTAEAAELAATLTEDKLKNLPSPGEVQFINGGPPCQGFSGMNRFNQGAWSKVQCEMILAFLSFADYFRPRFFLLENVRTFVSFNKGQTFRLTLASLLEMGYQVRFGILDAGAYGVSQSRKRVFIWAASPNEILPEWPEPMHVFAGPELKISLPGDVQYAAVRSTAGGAPFRSITVRDTIGDLPPVLNGASNPSISYGGDPVSWFQKQIRRAMLNLEDHITKEMNELNLIRCQHIPKRRGADWHDLPDKKVTLKSGEKVDLIPWCLPNTAKRHNQWKGLFGRLDWEGNFPTSITDPQPMGKVGMCFHPEQDRILTVRECARSQGFPDSYYFAGNIQNKYRQIGNAVPPPLAFALGSKLKEALDAKHSST